MAVTKKTSTKKVVAKKKVAPARKVTKPALKKVKAGAKEHSVYQTLERRRSRKEQVKRARQEKHQYRRRAG